jgi:hypothetical protein
VKYLTNDGIVCIVIVLAALAFFVIIYRLLQADSKSSIPSVYDNYDELSTFQIGRLFEDWVLMRMRDAGFEFVERSSAHGRGFQENDQFWDLLFRDVRSNRFIRLECKYQSKHYDDNKAYVVKSMEHLWRYRAAAAEHVPDHYLIVFGIGGRADSPGRLYSIPPKELKFNSMWLSQLEQWSLSDFGSIISKNN